MHGVNITFKLRMSKKKKKPASINILKDFIKTNYTTEQSSLCPHSQDLIINLLAVKRPSLYDVSRRGTLHGGQF